MCGYLQVGELRELLDTLELPSKGLKSELIDRLLEAEFPPYDPQQSASDSDAETDADGAASSATDSDADDSEDSALTIGIES